jgi:hypothetical protein
MYTPINNVMYTAAYDGAMAAMTEGARSPSSTTAADYTAQANAAGAWAQEFDTQWNSAATADMVQVGLAWDGSAGYWSQRGGGIPTPASLLQPVNALIAIITEAELYYASQGITPPAWGGSGSGVPGIAVITGNGGNTTDAKQIYVANTLPSGVLTNAQIIVANSLVNGQPLELTVDGPGTFTINFNSPAKYNGAETNQIILGPNSDGAAVSFNWSSVLGRWV